MLVELLLGVPALALAVGSAYLGWRLHTTRDRVRDLESALATTGRLLSSTIERLTAAEAALAAEHKAQHERDVQATSDHSGAADRLNGLHSESGELSLAVPPGQSGPPRL